MSRSSDLTAAARHIADSLYEAEDAAEAALARLGALMAAVPEARRAARLAAGSSHRIYAGLLKSSDAFVGGLASLVAVHSELADLKEQSLARTVAIGYPDKPEEDDPRPLGLRAVS